MRLLVVILHREEILDDVLSTLVEHELPDSVIVESRSGLELLERDLPIFAGLRSLIPGGVDFSRLVFCLIEDDTLAEHVVQEVKKFGDGQSISSGPTNTVMLLPVRSVEHF